MAEVMAEVEVMAEAEVKAMDGRVFYAVPFPRRAPPQRPRAELRGRWGCRTCNLQRSGSVSSEGRPEVRAGMAGRGWEEGMCAVGKGLFHVLGLAFIVQEEKRNQEKYQAFHTLLKCETSRVIKPLKGKVRY